jgi:hypothetical protein
VLLYFPCAKVADTTTTSAGGIDGVNGDAEGALMDNMDRLAKARLALLLVAVILPRNNHQD